MSGRYEPLLMTMLGGFGVGAGPATRADGSRRLVASVDAVLAEQGMQPLHLAAEAVDLLGQRRQVRVSGQPLVLAGGLVGEQLPFPVSQRRGLLEVLGVDGRLLVLAPQRLMRLRSQSDTDRRAWSALWWQTREEPP
jgi:hypothetical protein